MSFVLNPFRFGSAGASPALLASTKMSGPANGGTSPAINTTGASILVIVVVDYAVNSNSVVSDSQGNTYIALPASLAAGSNRCRIFYCLAPATSASHTVTVAGSAIYPGVVFAAFSGVTIFDQQNGNTGSGPTVTTGSITPTGPSLVIAALGHTQSSPTINSGFTLVQSGNIAGGYSFGMGMAYLIQATPAAVNPTWRLGGSSASAARIASFK